MNSMGRTQAAETASEVSWLALSKAYPFRTLPVEIVNEIFLHCLPSSDEEFQPTPSKAPLLLCHVSSYWRSAAMGDPRLWRRLTLSPKRLLHLASIEPLSRTAQEMVDQAHMWLANVKDLGLELDITIPHSHSSSTVTDQNGVVSQRPTFPEIIDQWRSFIMPVLVKQAGRFKALQLNYSFPAVLHSFFFGEEQDVLSKLESLTIKGDQLQISNTDGDPSNMSKHWVPIQRFAVAPRLTKAAILVKNKSPFPHQLPGNFLPWPQLTHLMITMPCSGSFWKRILQLCPNLMAAYINIEHSVVPEDCDPFFPGTGHIDLPRLKTLDVTFHDEFASAYFDDFRFPVLNHLLVACDFGSGFPTLTWVHPPPPRNDNCFLGLRTLISLTLSYQNMNEADLLAILGQAIQLQELILDSYLGDHKTFFQALVVKPHHESSDPSLEIAQPILPQLQVFKFFLEYASDVPPTTFDEEDFLAMMASRSEVARAVVNRFSEEPEPESKPQAAGGAELAKEENGDEKDAVMGDGAGAPISSTTIDSNPTPTETSLLHAKRVARLEVPPISSLITPIQQVEISTNAEESSGFKQLERFDRGLEKYNKDRGIPEQVPAQFSFLLEFSNPSDWALQDSEPQWF
ncbi:hypothetical protein EST38_g3364 [Candolleomyces aberdarensis]|uniref:Uncharacterized protein n=1 Tax=Candolleomyces aberdarensis TaxID=2316362 RepID=A0A4Q2DQL0_9AGAR|nr:hypothetical protein EST38_g3364 [Candolleomyces aberdarensis]